MTSVVGDAMENHYKQHRRPAKCVRCQWAKNRLKWEPQLPVLLPGWASSSTVSAEVARLGSTWVCITGRDSTCRFACTACGEVQALHGQPNIQTFQRHQTTSVHRHAVFKIIDSKAIGPTGVPVLGAPSHEYFVRVWEAGTPEDIPGIGSRNKIDKMLDIFLKLLNVATVHLLALRTPSHYFEMHHKGFWLSVLCFAIVS